MDFGGKGGCRGKQVELGENKWMQGKTCRDRGKQEDIAKNRWTQRKAVGYN